MGWPCANWERLWRGFASNSDAGELKTAATAERITSALGNNIMLQTRGLANSLSEEGTELMDLHVCERIALNIYTLMTQLLGSTSTPIRYFYFPN